MTKAEKAAVTLSFQHGALIAMVAGHQGAEHPLAGFPGLSWDERRRCFQGLACHYRELVFFCHDQGIALVDNAKAFAPLPPFTLTTPITPREHQQKAMAAWLKAQGHGVVSLPTGAGKTILAIMLIATIKRPTLVIVPTIDLMLQWQQALAKFLGYEAGALGGGSKEVKDVTVATYDSAHLLIETLGARFGFLVFDECHHLPAPQYRFIAEASLAPYRLGLSATVERADGLESVIYELLGDKVYHGMIGEMADSVLAPYDVVTLEVPMTEAEKAEYDAERKLYTDFIKRNRIAMGSRDGWQRFIMVAARSEDGRRALKAHRRQKKLAQASSEKMAVVFKLLQKHREQKVIIFTDDNALAYAIGERFILPVLTHQTKLKERKKMLAAFKTGEISVIATSKVLNEGVDVPDAAVGLVVSGGGGVREHVQRLGRILRQAPGKRAILYEIISKDTSEYYVNKRRGQHDAYQRSSEIHHP